MPETLKILVVDDEPSVREAIALILESPGYFIRTAVNGEEALAICQTERFDLVLSDMRMPGMNGQELLKRLRALDSRQKVMLVTAFPSTETQGGFDAVIVKPFTVRELRSRVSELLSKDHTVSHVYREPRLKAAPA